MQFENFVKEVKFDAHGLVIAIAQDFKTGYVLMLAHMNAETLKESLAVGRMVYWSRSRQKRWLKGEESGNFQIIKGVHLDCDGDAVLFHVEQVGGAACHTGYDSCFYRHWTGDGFEIDRVKMFDPAEKYGKK